MIEQHIFSEAEASELIANPRFGLGGAWRSPTLARALSRCVPFENQRFLSNTMRAFMSARTTSDEIDRFLKLWTSMNALRNHIAARFEAAQSMYLHVEPRKLPRRYRIQTMDFASLGSFAALIDPAHPLPSLSTLRTPAFRDAQRKLGDLAETLLRECKRNPRGVLAQLTEAPAPSASSKPHANDAENATTTEQLFVLSEHMGLSPLTFVMVVAAYELRNGLIHGAISMPLFADEPCKELDALGLCSLAIDAFLNDVLPQTVRQLDAGDGTLAPFSEHNRYIIARYLDHRFDGHGLVAKLRKHGLLW